MNIPFETSSALADAGARHGFFGRVGGVSEGDFVSLNAAVASGDSRAAVAENRTRVTKTLGVPSEALLTMKQVHSAKVVTIAGAAENVAVEADAMVTARPDLLLGILTADCCPILFIDPAAGVVGAAHAGWRGAVDGVIAATVRAMLEVGARRDTIRAAIGPTISAVNYEVGQDFRDAIVAHDPTHSRFFRVQSGEKPRFDLPAFVLNALAQEHLGAVEQVGGCTYAQPERYFSHRFATHAGRRTGRQLSVIGIG